MTICQSAIKPGQVWEASGTHAGLRVEVKSINALQCKVQTLKSGRGGGKSKRRLIDKSWHIRIPALLARYVLIEDVDEPKQPTTEEESMVMTVERPTTDTPRVTAHSTPEYKEAQRASWQTRFDEISEADRRSILELRGHVPISELLGSFKISKPVLGLVVRWGIQQGIATQSVSTPKPAAESSAPPVSVEHVTERAQIDDYEAPPAEPAQPPLSVDQFRVKLLVYEPVEVTRVFSAASYAAVEQMVQSNVSNLHEIIGIEKVR